jgi:uncharacterized repeat protein (TIGR03847 family)
MSDVADSFEFPDAQIFWPGADGPPGQRVFFLTGGTNGELVYLRCEKQQVTALAEYLRALLEDLAPTIDAAEDLGDVQPMPYRWTVGSIGVAYDSDRERIVVVLEEHTEEDEPAVARFTFSFAQAAAFAEYALDLVSRGRPNCMFCGQAMDPEGHPCPRMN